MPITAVVLAKNEENTISRCLQALSFCDEVIVLDDESTDATVRIAQEQNARIISRPLQGDFATQRNAAMEEAQFEWVLFVDADEVVSTELSREIQQVVALNKNDAFRIPRLDWFWGQRVEHGEVASARNTGFIRLVKKGSGAWVGTVHEVYKVSSGKSTGQLQAALFHYPHQTLTEFLLEINEYSTLRAKELFEKKYPFSLTEAIVYPLGKFLYTYFWKQGFKDGPAGFAYSFIMSFHSFLVRAKLYQYTVTSK